MLFIDLTYAKHDVSPDGLGALVARELEVFRRKMPMAVVDADTWLKDTKARATKKARRIEEEYHLAKETVAEQQALIAAAKRANQQEGVNADLVKRIELKIPEVAAFITEVERVILEKDQRVDQVNSAREALQDLTRIANTTFGQVIEPVLGLVRNYVDQLHLEVLACDREIGYAISGGPKRLLFIIKEQEAMIQRKYSYYLSETADGHLDTVKTQRIEANNLFADLKSKKERIETLLASQTPPTMETLASILRPIDESLEPDLVALISSIKEASELVGALTVQQEAAEDQARTNVRLERAQHVLNEERRACLSALSSAEEEVKRVISGIETNSRSVDDELTDYDKLRVACKAVAEATEALLDLDLRFAEAEKSKDCVSAIVEAEIIAFRQMRGMSEVVVNQPLWMKETQRRLCARAEISNKKHNTAKSIADEQRRLVTKPRDQALDRKQELKAQRALAEKEHSNLLRLLSIKTGSAGVVSSAANLVHKRFCRLNDAIKLVRHHAAIEEVSARLTEAKRKQSEAEAELAIHDTEETRERVKTEREAVLSISNELVQARENPPPPTPLRAVVSKKTVAKGAPPPLPALPPRRLEFGTSAQSANSRSSSTSPPATSEQQSPSTGAATNRYSLFGRFAAGISAALSPLPAGNDLQDVPPNHLRNMDVTSLFM